MALYELRPVTVLGAVEFKFMSLFGRTDKLLRNLIQYMVSAIEKEIDTYVTWGAAEGIK